MASILAERESQMQQFLELYFAKGEYSLEPMLGDAGQRNYYRMRHAGQSYIVMDCPESDVQRFIDIAVHLHDKGFSAPEIIQQDVAQGFLVLEDFGSLSVMNYLLSDSCKEISKQQDIYHLSIDLLVSLQEKDVPAGLVEFDNELLLSELVLFTDYYIPYAYKRNLRPEELQQFTEIWQATLAKQSPMPGSIVLRDYHVDNMMYLEERNSMQKLGLLDFQDALIGSPIYDLVSILEDARIEVGREEALQYVEYFVQKTQMEIEPVLLNYHILGAQRNSRILGVFARKSIRDSDDSYLQYMKRVLKYLEYDLSHAALSPLREWLENLE